MFVATRYATEKRSSSNVNRGSISVESLLFKEQFFVIAGNFYFLEDAYYLNFPDPYLTRNKELVGNKLHERPCFYAFGHSQIHWMIPISSNLRKFELEYQKKLTRYGRCDTIAFGQVLGYEKAFLIQNMCPVIPKYIKNEHIDTVANVPVKLDGVFEIKLTNLAKRVLYLERKGMRLIFPNVLEIEKALLAELSAT